MSETITVTIDGNDLRNLTSGIAGHYGNLRKLDLRFEPEHNTLAARVNGGAWLGPFEYQRGEEAATDPLARLRQIITDHQNGGLDDVEAAFSEVVELLPRAYSQLTG